MFFHCPTDGCGHAWPVHTQDSGRLIYCPECGRIVEIAPPRAWRPPPYGRLWRRLLAWVSHASPPIGNALSSGQPQPSPGIERLLHELGHHAWRKEMRHPPDNFLLPPAMLRQEAPPPRSRPTYACCTTMRDAGPLG